MSPRFRNRLILGALALMASAPMAARAQGLIIDRRPHVPIARSYDVREVTVDARVREQVAEVQVSQTFHNPGSFELETEYLFPMPDDGAIQNFVLMVDGREMPGRLLPKDEARRIFEEIVRTKRDPALLEYMGRGVFRTSVFPIPPNADRKVTLRYTQLLHRERDVVEFAYPFGTQKFTAKPIQRLALDIRIEARDPIKSLYSPSHDASIRREGDHEATVRLEQRDVTPSSDFRLVYTLAEGPIGASVVSYRPSDGDDGYFLLLASPQVKPPDGKPRPKTVVFALDRSGSMSGKKIEQARNALTFVLDNLREDDLFNIVAYDDRVETYKPELIRYTHAARAEAQRFVDNIRPGGTTNIDEALKASLGLLKDDSRPNYVLFLTDGLPTVGETRETAIAEHGREANRVHARLFTFGVGYDVNARLLDRLSGGAGGASEYVKPDEDIEAHVSRFYAKVTSPALTDIRVELSGTDLNRTYPRDIPDLFDGGQLVWVGRYRQAGRTTVRLSGKVSGERRTAEFPAELAGSGAGSRYDFVEKVWAMRRVGDIIDQIDLHGQNKELIDELVALSTRYGILTPYTSFLADERVQLHASVENFGVTRRNLEQLDRLEGRDGVGQRVVKGAYQAAEKPASAAPAPVATAAPAATFALREPTAKDRAELGRGFSAPGGAPSDERLRRSPYSRGAYGHMLADRDAARSETTRLGGAMGGAGGGMRGGPGGLATMQDTEGNAIAVATVRHLGGKTFYRKGDRWVDSTVKPEDEAKSIPLIQFSDEFFKLARTQTAELNQYLTFDDAVTVNLGNQTYRIDAARK